MAVTRPRAGRAMSWRTAAFLLENVRRSASRDDGSRAPRRDDRTWFLGRTCSSSPGDVRRGGVLRDRVHRDAPAAVDLRRRRPPRRPALHLATGIAVAFPRSPMVTAQTAWELAEATDGTLPARPRQPGPGAHRAALRHEFEPPVARLRDYVLAVQGLLARLPGRGAAGPRGAVLPAHPAAGDGPAAAPRARGPARSTSPPSARRWCAPPARWPTASTSTRCTPSPTCATGCCRRSPRARPAAGRDADDVAPPDPRVRRTR